MCRAISRQETPATITVETRADLSGHNRRTVRRLETRATAGRATSPGNQGATAGRLDLPDGAPGNKNAAPQLRNAAHGRETPPYFFADFFAGAGFAATFADFFAGAGFAATFAGFFTVAGFFAGFAATFAAVDFFAVGFFFIVWVSFFVSPPVPSPHGDAPDGKSLNSWQTKYFGTPFAFADMLTSFGIMPFE